MSLLGGLVLLCALGLLAARRPATLLVMYRVQSVALAVAAAWQGLVLAGCLILVGNGLLLPLLLGRVARLGPADAPDKVAGWQLGVAVLLAGVAALAMPAPVSWPAPVRLDLAMALAVLLVGLLGLLERRPLRQAVGGLSGANGVLLAAVAVADAPLANVAVLALLGLAAALLGGAYWRGAGAAP